uniref:Uncharacterized protein n=1 Tax=Lygus hesperus TaxID=30085 RepID=A0A146LTH6_LYGHE
MVNLCGKQTCVAKNAIGVIITVDSSSCNFNVGSILRAVRTLCIYTAEKDATHDTSIPSDIITNGSSNADHELYRDEPTDDAITIAAHEPSDSEPNRSAPIPAISPTLSPTLSAITAGFLGSSSGKSLHTLPLKSAPTSAAFVYIPPPTRPNSAIDDPPNPYPAIDSNNLCATF